MHIIKKKRCVLDVICFLTVVETIALQVGQVTIQLSGPSIVPETKQRNFNFKLLVLVAITSSTIFKTVSLQVEPVCQQQLGPSI